MMESKFVIIVGNREQGGLKLLHREGFEACIASFQLHQDAAGATDGQSVHLAVGPIDDASDHDAFSRLVRQSFKYFRRQPGKALSRLSQYLGCLDAEKVGKIGRGVGDASGRGIDADQSAEGLDRTGEVKLLGLAALHQNFHRCRHAHSIPPAVCPSLYPLRTPIQT